MLAGAARRCRYSKRRNRGDRIRTGPIMSFLSVASTLLGLTALLAETFGSFAFAHDRTILAAARGEGAVRLWDTATGELRGRLEGVARFTNELTSRITRTSIVLSFAAIAVDGEGVGTGGGIGWQASEMRYKRYLGVVEVDPDAGLIHGRVAGLPDVITFLEKTVAQARQAFHGSVDDYLECGGHRPARGAQAGQVTVAIVTIRRDGWAGQRGFWPCA